MKSVYRDCYPFIFKLGRKKLLFIGGGKVAERKIEILYTIAKVTVVAPKVTERLDELYKLKKIKVALKSFEEDDLKENFTFIFVCTNDLGLNRHIGKLAHAQGKFVFVAGDKNMSDFFMPAVFKNDAYIVATYTYNNSPLDAKKIRDYIKGILTNGKFSL
jgi:siroheme synthase-like protein